MNWSRFSPSSVRLSAPAICFWLVWSVTCAAGPLKADNQFGIEAVPGPADWELGHAPTSQLVVAFPQTFARPPALRVTPASASESEWPLPITRLTTNQFAMEVPMIPHPQMLTGLYFNTEGDAALTDRFPFETSFGSLAGRQAMIGLDPEAPKADRLFITLAGESPGLRFWQARRIDLDTLLAESGRPLAAGLVNQRIAVLWTGPEGLCFSQSAGAFGELPWTTEVLSPETPLVDRASMVEAKDQVLISLVRLESNLDRSGIARLTAWRRLVAGRAGSWQKQAVAEVEIPPAYEPRHQFMVTRTGWQGNHLLLTFDLQRGYLGQSIGTWPIVSTDGVQAIYVADASDAASGWTLVASEPLDAERIGSVQPIKGGFRLEAGNGGGWRLQPFDQWLEYDGRPARFHREFPVPGGGPWPDGPLAPQLDWLPDQIQWTASDQPALTWTVAGDNWISIGGYGVPSIGDLEVRYRVLHSPSLIQPAWQEVERIGADESGFLYHWETKVPSAAAGFYRLEEVR